jgi:hypothetical protein
MKYRSLSALVRPIYLGATPRRLLLHPPAHGVLAGVMLQQGRCDVHHQQRSQQLGTQLVMVAHHGEARFIGTAERVGEIEQIGRLDWQ